MGSLCGARTATRDRAGVNADGHREILGLDVCSAESEAGWLTLFRGLNARGLTGVKLVTSDAHSGLVAAVAATLEGASWQRCRTHYAANPHLPGGARLVTASATRAL